MSDVQLLRWREVLAVENVRYEDGVLFLQVPAAHLAERVLVDGASLSFFVPDSTTIVLPRVPSPPKHVVVLGAVHNSPVSSSRVELSFSFPLEKAESGVAIAQRFLLMLLSDPNRDVIHPSVGGGLLRLIGRDVPDQAVVEERVRKAVRDVIRSQRPDVSKERLIGAEVTAYVRDDVTGEVFLVLRLETSEGSLDLAPVLR